jgi:uncharacterized protein (DUF2147 family)
VNCVPWSKPTSKLQRKAQTITPLCFAKLLFCSRRFDVFRYILLAVGFNAEEIMSKMSGMVSTATVVGALLIASFAAAQNADMVRVRGTIQGVDGQTLDVKGRDGAPIKVKLAARKCLR